MFFDWGLVETVLGWLTFAVAIVVAIYTAFLFAQAKGRDFWQSPTLGLHMLVHSVMAGAAVMAVLGLMGQVDISFVTYTLTGAIILNLLIMLFELTMAHPTVKMNGGRRCRGGVASWRKLKPLQTRR